MSGDMSLKLTGMIWMVAVVVCLSSMSGAGGEPGFSGDWLPLSLRGPQHWSFVGEPWVEDEVGVITPADWDEDHVAFYVGRAYDEVEAEFEYRWPDGHGTVGFVLGAQDPCHYHLVHFPLIAQNRRGKNFTVAVSQADGSGWLKNVEMDLLRGVARSQTEQSVWHHVRLALRGGELRVWVDQRPFRMVHLPDYEPGYVGLHSWGFNSPGGSFRNVRIRGTEVPPQAWNKANQPPQNWFHPYPVEGQQSTGGITRVPNGELLVSLSPGGLVWSTDNGRTWSPVEAEGFPGGNILTTSDGELISLSFRDNHVLMARSEDNGKTWSDFEDRAAIPLPEGIEKLHPSLNPVMELNDGTLLVFLYGSHDSTSGKIIYEWGSVHNMAYSIRSTDGGQTWEGPTSLDGPPAVGINYDMCEPTATQTADGRVLCLSRPIYSPWMWESWSEDQGASWGPSMRGPFPGYACSMLPHATASGALLIAGRMPGLSLHVSLDNGITWQQYRTSFDIWSMGAMCEVAPDLVLWVYMDNNATNLRAQYIRITEHGAEPARDMLPRP